MSINTKIVKVNDTYSVTMCANGYVVEISGRNADDAWCSTKLICTSISELYDLILEIDKMDKETI